MMYDDACLVAPTCVIMSWYAYVSYVMTYNAMLYMYVMFYCAMICMMWNSMNVMLCHVKSCYRLYAYMTYMCTMTWKKGRMKWFLLYAMILNMGSHAFMYIICIGIFYVSTDKYLRYFLPCCSTMCQSILPDETRPKGMYTSSPSGSMCACVGHVWGDMTHPTLLKLKRAQGHTGLS